MLPCDRQPTAPETCSLVPDAMPSLIETLFANGVLWIGYNVLTVEGGDLGTAGNGSYDAGDGISIGMAFGNSEDVKNFFELIFEQSINHEIFDATGARIANADHNRLYIGARHYLSPVGGRKRRASPFVVLGLVWHSIDNTGPGDPAVPASEITNASGMGVYAGTGLELGFGTKGQASLGLDLRGSYWNWEGRPQDTGEQGTITSSVALVFHF